MVTLVTVGTLLISTGPCIAVWLGMFRRRAHLLVIAIVSAFVWCVSLVLASVIWLAIPPLKDTYGWNLFVAVTSQELFRLGLFLLFRFTGKSSNGIQVFLRVGPRNELLTGLAVGLGFATMSSLIHFFSVLANDYSDDTAIYDPNCPMNFFVGAASFALAFTIMHVMLGILVWPAYSDPDGRNYVLAGYAIHIFFSEMSLGNMKRRGCTWTLPILLSSSLVLSVATAVIARRRIKNAQ